MCVQKLSPCFLCGTTGHLVSECPNKHCNNCSLPGHLYNSCSEKAYWHKQCHRCGVKGHFFDVSIALSVLPCCSTSNRQRIYRLVCNAGIYKERIIYFRMSSTCLGRFSTRFWKLAPGTLILLFSLLSHNSISEAKL